MDKSMVACFFWLTVYRLCQYVESVLITLMLKNEFRDVEEHFGTDNLYYKLYNVVCILKLNFFFGLLFTFLIPLQKRKVTFFGYQKKRESVFSNYGQADCSSSRPETENEKNDKSENKKRNWQLERTQRVETSAKPPSWILSKVVFQDKITAVGLTNFVNILSNDRPITSGRSFSTAVLTLTFDLDLWRWPLKSQRINLAQMLNICAKLHEYRYSSSSSSSSSSASSASSSSSSSSCSCWERHYSISK